MSAKTDWVRLFSLWRWCAGTILGCILGMTNFAVCAEDVGMEKSFVINGFGTLGISRNNNDRADFVRGNTQKSGVGYTHNPDLGVDSRIGVQFTIPFTENVDAIVQAVSKRNYENTFRPELSWAFVRFNLNDNIQWRVGRLGFDVFLFADSRDIGYSYVPVRPPVEFYGSLLDHLNGTDIVFKYGQADNLFSLKLFAGLSDQITPSTLPAGKDSSNKGSPMLGGWLEYQNMHWLYRLGYSQMKVVNEVPDVELYIDILRSPGVAGVYPGAAAFADRVGLKDNLIHFATLGIAYNNGPFNAQLTFGRVHSHTLLFAGNDVVYAGGNYRFGTWTPFVSFSGARALEHPHSTGIPEGVNAFYDALNDAAMTVADQTKLNQHTWSFGTRWDFYRNMDLKFQGDLVESSSTYLFHNKQPDWNGRAFLLTATFDFIF